MNYRFAGLLIVPVAAALLLGIEHAGTRDGDPAPACTTATLRGGFGMTATGSFAGVDLGAIQAVVFDGAGKVTGHGTAVLLKPSVVIPFELQEGTYTVNADCTGTMHWFGHHPTIAPVDHLHNADLVVSDGGKQLSLIYTSTQFPGGTPPVPVESFTFWGHHM
ncbi:MAG: hypothetical protein JWQ07_5068 [Ramlibacter sp.]|nr:hypothetical protein [Ramlibacter sp.]